MGRIQGLVFVIGVAGPRLGDTLMGTYAEVTNVPTAAVAGGLACTAGALALTFFVRRRRLARGGSASVDLNAEQFPERR